MLALLEKASSYEQLSERGTIRAKIQMDLGQLYKIKKRPDLAREHLQLVLAPQLRSKMRRQ